jgi:hypothetical protein
LPERHAVDERPNDAGLRGGNVHRAFRGSRSASARNGATVSSFLTALQESPINLG